MGTLCSKQRKIIHKKFFCICTKDNFYVKELYSNTVVFSKTGKMKLFDTAQEAMNEIQKVDPVVKLRVKSMILGTDGSVVFSEL